MDNILISCAGGPAAIGAIKSLKQINFKGNIVTIDCDPLAVGRYLSDVNYIVPLSTSVLITIAWLGLIESNTSKYNGS